MFIYLAAGKLSRFTDYYFFYKNSVFIVHWYSSPNRNSWTKAAAVLWLFSKYMVHYLYSCMSPVVSRQVLFSVVFFSFKGFNLEPSCAIFIPYSLDRPTPLWAVLKTGFEWAWRLSNITLTLRWQLKASENHGSSGRKNWLVEEKCVNMQSVAWAWGRERNWFQTHFLILFVVLHFPVRDISCSFTLSNYLCTAAAICSESTQS